MISVFWQVIFLVNHRAKNRFFYTDEDDTNLDGLVQQIEESGKELKANDILYIRQVV